MKPIKIFKPDMFLSDSFKVCWTTNVEMTDSGIPLCKELRENKILALDIVPKKLVSDQDWFAICFPVARDWSAVDLSKENSPKLKFEVVAADRLYINVSSETEDKIKSPEFQVKIEYLEDFKNIEIPLDPMTLHKLRIIQISGSVELNTRFILKDIVIE